MRKIILKEACVEEVKSYLRGILSLLLNKTYADLYNEEIVRIFSQIAFELLENEDNVISGRDDFEFFAKKFVNVTYDLLCSLTEKKNRISEFKINMYQNFLELAIESLSQITENGELLTYPYVENKTVYRYSYNPQLDYYNYAKITAGVFKERL